MADKERVIDKMINVMYEAYLRYSKKNEIINKLKELLKKYGEDNDVEYYISKNIAVYGRYLYTDKIKEIKEAFNIDDISVIFIAGTGDVVAKYMECEEIGTEQANNISLLKKFLEFTEKLPWKTRVFDCNDNEEGEAYHIMLIIDEQSRNGINTVVVLEATIPLLYDPDP